MSPAMLRQIWSLIETTQTNLLLNLDDDSLVQCLLRELMGDRTLDSHEAAALNRYIHSRLPLIRDVAHSRRALV